MNPLLAKTEAMSYTGPYYANLNCTHFVGAQQVIAEGGRRYMGQPEGLRLQLKVGDEEGKLIQSSGVVAVVYTAKLWEDTPALLALMREGNLDAATYYKERD